MDIKNQVEHDPASIGVNLNRNLSKLMEDNHVTLSVLYRNTGIAIPTIKRLQSDPTTNPTITTLLPIAAFFNISISQLIGSEPFPSETREYIENKANWLKVPLIFWEQAISWNKTNILADSFVLVDIDVGQFPFALKVEEDDWSSITKGSILIINSEIKPENKDYALVYKKSQTSPTLKQVLIDDGKLYLKSLNQYIPPVQLDEEHQFLGVLIQIRKNTKV